MGKSDLVDPLSWPVTLQQTPGIQDGYEKRGEGSQSSRNEKV